jgi:hypothetical protein
MRAWRAVEDNAENNPAAGCFTVALGGEAMRAERKDVFLMDRANDGSMNRQRICAAGELCLLTLLFWATIWGSSFGGVTVWNVAAGLAFFITIATSAILRRPGWKDSGFRIDNLRPALLRVGAITICVVGLTILAFRILGAPFFWSAAKTLADRLLFGIAQQALLLGYLFPQWLVLLRRPLLASVANSLWFGLVHFPDIALVLVAALGGLYFHWLFFRMPNVLVIGLAHGVLSFFALPLLLAVGAMRTPRIGPPQLNSFATAISRDSAPGDRIGICSGMLASDLFGPRFDRKVEGVIDGGSDEPSMRDSFSGFLTSKERVFCVVTEREFQRWANPELKKKIYLLSDRFVWRNWKNGPQLEGNDGFLVLFRERVLLISNQPVN